MISAPRTIELKDLPALSKFLVRVYKFDSSDKHADIKLLEWKYLSSRTGWKGSRSYVLEKDGQIIAHCGVCPVTLNLPNGKVLNSITMMDWAADPSVPGVGVMLFCELMAKAPASFLIGGAPPTRHLAPRMGFRQLGEIPTYSAWLRPWREFRIRPRTGESAARLLHGWSHPARRRLWFGHPWKAVRVREFDESLQPILNRTTRSWTACKRSIADLNYLLQCPHLETRGFLLQNKGKIAGYFIAGRYAWEARLLDLMVDSEDPEAWKGACLAIIRAIRPDPEVCRIRVMSTIPILSKALQRSGYWRHYTEPLFIHDRSNELEKVLPVSFQLCDGDAGY